MTGLPLDPAWLPLAVAERPGGIEVDWAHMGGARFTEPFFADTAHRLARRPFNQLFRPRTAMAELVARSKRLPGLPLAGLVFHMSRCGSTLAAQALASLPDSVVLSEPGPLDTLLRSLHGRSAPDLPTRLAWLRALAAALGQPRRDGDRRLFIKLDSWHMGWFPLLRAAFPETPWLFIYREPLEVLVSQQRQVGLTALPGHVPDALLAESPGALSAHLPMENATRVLWMIMLAAVRALTGDEQGMTINHRALPDALWTTLDGHFRLGLSAPEIETMRTACRRDAKRPDLMFEGDSEAKRAQADAHLRTLAGDWLAEPYLALEDLASRQAR